MNTCMKCGCETEEKYVFCEHCLGIMEKYPVKPGTPLHLPRRNTVASVKKTSRRKTVTPEEQVLSLRKTVRVLVACLVLVLAVLGFFVWHFLTTDHVAPPADENPIGQNYTVDPSDSRSP